MEIAAIAAIPICEILCFQIMSCVNCMYLKSGFIRRVLKITFGLFNFGEDIIKKSGPGEIMFSADIPFKPNFICARGFDFPDGFIDLIMVAWNNYIPDIDS